MRQLVDGTKQRKILIVEDNKDSLHVYALMLRHSGFDVIEATTGRDGVERAVAEHPDLVLMDMNIPNFDGWEAARQIRLDADTATLPLIAFSASVDCTADLCRDNKVFDGFIAKPVSPSDLLRRVRAYVELIARSPAQANRAGRESAERALPDEMALR